MDSTLTIHLCRSRRRPFPRIKRTRLEYTVDLPHLPSRNIIHLAPLRLKIPNHTPCIYFDAAIVTHNNHHQIVIVLLAINMDAPNAPNAPNAPSREPFMAGVNSIGADGRLLPAGAAAASRMTAAYAAEQEARREANEETISMASTAVEDPKGEQDIAKKKEGGEQKSLIRRLFGGVGDKVAAALKREQGKEYQEDQ
ncbi:unnamed protein product [Aureobasidium mustum]|uniref:Uncharacterized protein n=1 Tax=Aureobasidium mustum TaxID=2773714 RepID=A0A9N8JWP0_9PEZI|nr:unnamed protein product [Aureobasidium mustum]